MAIPSDRDSFKDYCLRALGDGVIQINASDEQIEDRIDEALYLYQQRHMDAVVQAFLPHQITASSLTVTPISGTFANGEYITGATSNTFGTFFVESPTNTLSFVNSMRHCSDANLEQMNPSFTVGEVVRGATSNATATVESVTLGDFDNGWIQVDPQVIAVTKIFAPYDSRIGADILFDPQSQFNMSLLSNFTSSSIIPYVVGRQYQQLLNDTFRGRPPIRFQRHLGRLYLDVNMFSTFPPGRFVMIDCMRVIDPSTYPLVWSDRFLQRLAIAYIKRQWGMNLSKWTGIALPGGVSLDGRAILSEANQEIKDLEAELKLEFELPPSFIVG